CRQSEPALLDVGQARVAACIRPEATPAIQPPPAGARVASSGEVVLKAEGVCKDFVTRWRLFGAPTVFRAVDKADFVLRENEFVGIVGESGSGKSTLARLVVGLEQPTQGKLTLLGRDVTANGAAERA